MDKKWSQDWATFDWEKAISAMRRAEQEGTEGQDIGLSRESILEYGDWLRSEAPEEYVLLMLGWKLHELGMDAESLDAFLKDPEALALFFQELDKKEK